jgi:hypothetical protein
MDEKQTIKKILGEIDFILDIYEDEDDWEGEGGATHKTIMKKLRKIRELLNDYDIKDEFLRTDDDKQNPKLEEVYDTVVDELLGEYDHEMNTTEEEWKNFPPPPWSVNDDWDIQEKLKELKKILKKK